MSDWDVFAPVEAQPNQDDEEPADAFFHADTDGDSFGGASVGSVDSTDQSLPTEPASFNPRMAADQRPRRAGRQAAQLQDPSSYSYTERRFHAGEESAKPSNNRRGSLHRRGQKEHETISHELLEEGGFDEAKYAAFHDAAVAQRATAGVGNSAEMNSLYFFWCYYLRSNFNREMYDEFLDFARRDIEGGCHYAIECFFRLCSYGLELRWDETMFEDFQNEALLDYQRGSKYGLEKVKSFLVHQKHDFEIRASEEMDAVLEQFPTLESFKDPNEAPKVDPRGPRNPRRMQPKAQDDDPRRRGRGGGRGRGRGKQGRYFGEPRERTMGRSQPASAPHDSPMRKGWRG